MSLALFIDHCVPTEISTNLRDRGHAVRLLRDAMPIRSPDETVLATAKKLGAILVSLNGDFADIVTYPPTEHLGVVAIQLHNHPEIIPELLERLGHLLDANPNQEWYHGKLIIVEVHHVRIRQ